MLSEISQRKRNIIQIYSNIIEKPNKNMNQIYEMIFYIGGFQKERIKVGGQ